MTNKEKFTEVFGFTPEGYGVEDNISCPLPVKICKEHKDNCLECPFCGWWEKEYKPCFKLRDDI